MNNNNCTKINRTEDKSINFKSKKVQQRSEKTIISEDGIIKKEEKELVSYIAKEPPYVKIYIQDILYLSDLPAAESSVLYAFIKLINYKGQIIISSGMKQMIANEINKSIQTINNSITKFVTAGILIREAAGVYTANPYLFGRGEWSEIDKLRVQITYDLNGRTFRSVLTTSKNKNNENNESLAVNE